MRLFFYFKGKLLKVRHARPEEKFKNPSSWMNTILFEITTSPDFMMIWTTLLPDLPRPEAEALLSLIGARYPFSPHYDALQKSNPDIVFHSDEEEWIFFGGSFNPWHKGHQACLDLIGVDKTCFVIPDRNPLKELREIDPIFTVLELSSKIRFRNNQYLVPTFLLDQRKNPTIEWVDKLKKKLPTKKISLLLGFDSFVNFPNWTKVQDLLPNLHALYIVSRLEHEEEQKIHAKKIHELAPNIMIEFLGRHQYEKLSSTQIREKKAGKL